MILKVKLYLEGMVLFNIFLYIINFLEFNIFLCIYVRNKNNKINNRKYVICMGLK